MDTTFKVLTDWRILLLDDIMDRKTVFIIIFVLFSFVILFMVALECPSISSKFATPEPKTVEIGGINFTVPAGYFKDNSSQQIHLPDGISDHIINRSHQSFWQNDILLLDVCVLELEGTVDLNELNDGTYEHKSINGVKGIFKSKEVTTSSGFVENTHLRYYFNYIQDNKLIMLQCDNLKTIEGML